ncbi:type I-C CRISPR-associated protein Cas8c/Csd1 [Pseudogemmobacter blasticus]|uniref:Type I-C CRISPR-associated protein Cas8c/Csd1 n=1 Tax=Fuscovulum blasticum DSM 2131 TaxID=1188250 RepID=A0A2T4J5B1_FUSBL|nr:type I-C CRISPR-associated protein Cas8c/Csd1 [Fuscovulum blasticum]PTE13082.1 type I-C CRISPR-associated protein Cas8c/Csd1 [Fuscovulum blasticum DSM 2131]
MNLLSALAAAYDRLPHAPPYGYSSEKIGFCVILNPDGTVAEVADLRGTDKKRSPRIMQVPAAVKRAVNIAPNFLWDKSAYVLGVAGEGAKRVDEVHAAFCARHRDWLDGTTDEGLVAFLRFLDAWRPDAFAALGQEDIRDANIVFRLGSERGFLHDRPAARALWRRIGAEGASNPQTCLLTAEKAPVARLHPSVKGVWGGQSSGSSLVSFNLDAFTSYGHEQGDNAPVSEAATFAYTTALNLFLSDKHHRLQIGDTSTVFWAEAEESAAAEAESLFAGFFDTAPTREDIAAIEATLAQKVGEKLGAIREGKPLVQILPDLAGARFHVLGLAPNAARLSVRFYWDSTFGQLVANYQRFLADMALDPPPRDGWPPLWRYLVELAVQGKRENVPPLIAGEWMRAILTGGRYPMTLLSTTLMRVRSDGEVNAYRAAILKSVLKRNLSMEAPVALDPANQNKGYILGRLFAVYEEVQRAALGGHVNATIKDKFYGAASATPQKVFRTLDAGSQNHFSKLRKLSAGRAVNLEKLLTSITDLMEPGNDPIPSSLSAAEQALFGIGYYHQRSDFFRKRDEADPEGSPVTDASA